MSACGEERPNRRMAFEVQGVTEISAWRVEELANDIAEGLSLAIDETDPSSADWQFRFVLEPDSGSVSDQGAILTSESGKTVIRGKTLQGLSNGIYTVLADHGVIYLHP